MISILTAEQIRAWDAYTIANEPISGEGLMERASNAFVNWFVTKFDAKEKIGIVCGKGNNGGDGIVIGRLLSERKYNVRTLKAEDNLDLSSFTVIIDAIFGSGLSRPADSEAIRVINQSKAIKVSVDVPSGLRMDAHSEGDIVKADYTITFQMPKLAFMFPENADYVGEWKVVDIGLSPSFKTDSKMFYIDEVHSLIHPRKKFSHKGDYGRALLIAGSFGKMGACVLASRAALRSGAGLLTVHVPKCGYTIIQSSVPEAMASVDTHEDYFSDVDTSNYDVIGIGPGIGVTASTVSGLRKALQPDKPMVIDADALNILSGSRELMHLIPEGSILTPHPGEFRRLVGDWKNDFERLELQKSLSAQTKCVVILKGAHTSIASPNGEVYFNSTGNPGMAKGGSGDVLTGVLTGLLSQKYPALEAAIIGVYIHGLAGDLAAGKLGQNALLAGDLVEFLGQSFGR
jgi:ADP-dependent NAD(P)H-hydrate dehydratase / NAD(P)H-hydrate epimerase